MFAAFQVATELFKQKTGAPMQEIPYKGANDFVMAVISANFTATIADAGPVSGQIKGGQVRALAVAAPKRVDDLPDVPTMKEAGADVEAVLWSGLFAPKNTPPAIVKKLEGELMKIARMPDVIERLKPLGIDLVGNSSEEFSKILAPTSRDGAQSPKPPTSRSNSNARPARRDQSHDHGGHRGNHDIEYQRAEPDIEHVAGAAEIDGRERLQPVAPGRPRAQPMPAAQPSSRPGAEPAREQAEHHGREGLQDPHAAEQLQVERDIASAGTG